MNPTEKLKLIEGVFSNDDATEILVNIFFSKINFHQSKNFSSQERFGKNNEAALQRMSVLTKELEKLQSILEEAKLNNKKLVINSEINISLLDD